MAYYGVKGSSPLGVVGAANTANNTTTVTAPGLTTSADGALVLAFFASNSNSTYSTAAGMAERHDAATTGMSNATDDMSQVTAGATGDKTSTASASGRVVGHQVAFNVDDVAPSVAQTDPGTPLAGTVSVGGTASDADSAIAQVQFQRSPAGAGSWTNIGSADTSSPYSVSFDTTTVTDGLYDFRAVATDVAGNTATSSSVGNRRVDNTAPSSTTSFPAASTTYGAPGWNAGCGTTGFCGTASDGGSGVQSVEISIRQGAGNYWSTGCSPARSEVWTATTLAGGDWSYAFAAANFPADGSYTVRVRSTDAPANVETPSSRTFMYRHDGAADDDRHEPLEPHRLERRASFTFSSSEGSSTFECRIDGGVWGTCTSGQNYPEPRPTAATHSTCAPQTRSATRTPRRRATPGSSTRPRRPRRRASRPRAASTTSPAGTRAARASGLCGTYGDGAGSGVSQVQVSIRQGTGNYWDGTAFSAAPRSGTRRASRVATGRTPSRRRASRPTTATRCACARSTRARTRRRRQPHVHLSTAPTRAPSTPSRPPAPRTTRRAGTRAARPTVPAARTPTPGPASPRSRSR